MISITVNGDTFTCEVQTSVQALLAQLRLEALAVVVEYNGKILAREFFAQTLLSAGDCLEIVQMMGGG